MTTLSLKPPRAVRWIVGALEDAGHETWVVGGAIRDGLLGIEHDDWDLATRARPEEVRALFRRTVPIGVDHGTVGVLSRGGVLYEVTTFRRDVETFGRRAVVEFADRIEDDLARRDFTINAVAWHPLNDLVRDPFGGLQDLDRGILRTVGSPQERFSEDFLRVLRALRFAGRYRLTVDAPTWHGLVSAVPHLEVLSAERVREEVMKLLSLDPRPSGSLSLYASTGVFGTLLPELPVPDHGSAAAREWARRVLTVDQLPRTRPVLRLAALLEGLDGQSVAAVLVRLRFSNAVVRDVGEISEAMRSPVPRPTGEDVRRWLARIGPERLKPWIRIQSARRRVRCATGEDAGVADLPEVVREARAQIREGAPLDVEDLAVDGRTLIRMGFRPGPAFGRVLDALLDRCLSDPSLNTADRLEPLARELAEKAVSGDGDR